LKLRDKEEFFYKEWLITRMDEINITKCWVAHKHLNLGKLNTFRTVMIASFDSVHKIRPYVQTIDKTLGQFAAPQEENQGCH
jgi:hypothetical protein